MLLKTHNTAEDLVLNRAFHKIDIPDIKVASFTGNPLKSVKTAIQWSFFKTLKALDKNASLHGAEKSLVSLPEFAAWKDTIPKSLIREGMTAEQLSSPEIQEYINQTAFQKSLRAKFMQDNTVHGAQGALEEYFIRKNLPVVADVINGLLPVTKISSNYISEAITKLPVVGGLKGGLSLGVSKLWAKAMGEDSSLTDKQKTALLRTLKFQGVGLFTYALGMALYKNFNPSYHSSAKQYAKDKNNDEEESSWLTLFETLSHSPDALVFQAGVSHAWVWDKYDDEHPEDNSMSTFMEKTAIGLKENTGSMLSSSPYLRTDQTLIQPILEGKGVGKPLANFLKSRLPFTGVLNDVSQGKIPVLNKLGVKSGNEEAVKPAEIGLYPKGFWDNIGVGIPGWRQDVLHQLYDKKYNSDKSKTDKQLDDAEDAEDKRLDKADQFAREHGF